MPGFDACSTKLLVLGDDGRTVYGVSRLIVVAKGLSCFLEFLAKSAGHKRGGFVCPPGYLAHTGGTFFSALHEYLFQCFVRVPFRRSYF